MKRLASVALVTGAVVAATSAGAPTALRSVPSVEIDALSWSPDGRWLAYAARDWDDHSRTGLYIVRADRAGGRQPLVRGFLPDAVEWSPRGAQVAGTNGYTTWIATPRRGKIQFEGQFGDWSPDGTKILLVRYAPGVEGSTIWVADVNTGATQYLVDGQAPQWSPDGRRIAVSVVVRVSLSFCFESHLFSVAANGAESRRLTNDPPPYGSQIADAWFPDSSRVLYSESEGDCDNNVKAMVVRSDGSRRTEVLGRGGPTLLPNGRVALSRFGFLGPTIEIVTLRGKRTAYFRNAFGFFDSSPDGRRFAYSDGPGIVVGWTGKSTDRHSLGTGDHASWSKQNWIAFSAEGSCGSRRVERVFVVRPNGKHRHALSRC